MTSGQSACSAKRSMRVSSRAEDPMEPDVRAPMARARERVVAHAEPVPSCEGNEMGSCA